MSALDALTARLVAAARKPPEVVADKLHVTGARAVMSSARTSSGKARPVVRQTLAQQQRAIDQARDDALAGVRENLTSQARESLLP